MRDRTDGKGWREGIGMATQNRQTGAALLAVGVANTTRSGVGRRHRGKRQIARVGVAALSLLALTSLASISGADKRNGQPGRLR